MMHYLRFLPKNRCWWLILILIKYRWLALKFKFIEIVIVYALPLLDWVLQSLNVRLEFDPLPRRYFDRVHFLHKLIVRFLLLFLH